MKRLVVKQRDNATQKNEKLGFDYNIVDGNEYWSEDVCYQLTSKEVDELEKATQTIHDLCIEACQKVIAQKLYDKLMIPAKFIKSIEQSWDDDIHTMYGRMDLAYDGVNPPKLLEYNADTPTSLVETAIIQWHWMEEQAKAGNISHNDQFNSIHERLIEYWKDNFKGETVYFAYYGESQEDYRTVEYLADTAEQGGVRVKLIAIENIGFDNKALYDEENKKIEHIFKLYPYEWLMHEPFQDALTLSNVVWIEPQWKSIISNKAFMALLWDMYPNHPNLLPTYFSSDKFKGKESYVEKPIFGREGNGVSIHTETSKVEDKSAPEPMVYQKLNLLPQIDDYYFQIGSWVIDGEAAGICIREDKNPIMTNKSRFVPHYF